MKRAFCRGVVWLCVSILPLVGSDAKATFGYETGFEPASDGDTYQPGDSNPFDEPGARGVTHGGNLSEGGGADDYWWDIRNVPSSRKGYGEEVLAGHNGITSASGSGHFEIYGSPTSQDGSSAPVSGYVEVSTRAGGNELTRKLTDGPSSVSFDLYLNPLWLNDTNSGAAGSHLFLFYHQVLSSDGNLVDGAEFEVFHPTATMWSFGDVAGPLGSTVTDAGGWRTLEFVTFVASDGSDDGEELDVLITINLWTADHSSLLFSNTSQTPGSGDGDLAYGHGVNSWQSFSNAIRNAPAGSNFLAIDNYRVGDPLTLVEIPEPMSAALLVGGLLPLLMSRLRRS